MTTTQQSGLNTGVSVGLRKSPTGIDGLDEITDGGLPAGRSTLICGAAGCGKTLMAMEFLVRGATQFDEPGVFFAFEEQVEELADNVRSLGFDLNALIADNRLGIEFLQVDPLEIAETGEYDLEGLFIRLGFAIDSIGAKRVVLDTVEALFGGLSNQAIVRAELQRLFRWLKERGVTAIITCERGEGTLTRHGIEEYVSDCVILLDHRVIDQVSTRRLRIIKYRGSVHGTNEYPFLIDKNGIAVLPITSIKLDYQVQEGRVSSGVTTLDHMLGGEGYYAGSTILISGTAGTGKTTLASHFVDATCRRGERCLFVGFEESPSQLARNMKSVGIDLGHWERAGTLLVRAERPTIYGYEMHLAMLQRSIRDFRPNAVVLDPISGLVGFGSQNAAGAMLMRLIDFLDSLGITCVLTTLIGMDPSRDLDLGVPSLVDTWILLRDSETAGVRQHTVAVLKSRGMPHSNRAESFAITSRGIEISLTGVQQ
ncbi:MAG TPA: circadian clock protein KaiC [Gemmatimonas sp.]|nr:circadian clock protein KaiC [Gemmatimonas sp.]